MATSDRRSVTRLNQLRLKRGTPPRLYGQGGSHYQGQGLKLSKHFRAWE